MDVCSDVKKLNDKELMQRLKDLVRGERELTCEILLHLIEMEVRKLYLPLGYPSIYQYCISGLQYSESATKRRITASRWVRKFPEVYELLKSRKLSLSVVCSIASIITEENKAVLLTRVMGKRRIDVEAVVASYKPVNPVKDRITAIVVKQSAQEELPLVAENELANNRENHMGSQRTHVELSGNSEEAQVVEQNKQYKIECAVSEEFYKKLKLVEALLSNKIGPGPSIEAVLEPVLDEFIERHSPEKKEARRQQRQQKKQIAEAVRALSGKAKRAAKASRPSRYIREQDRDRALVKAGLCCSYEGENGVRCSATKNLHIDHIVPHACSGTNTIENLRVLCAMHNRLEAERVLGDEFMKQFY